MSGTHTIVHAITGEHSHFRRWTLVIFARYLEMPLLRWGYRLLRGRHRRLGQNRLVRALLGARLAGLHSRIVGVRIIEEDVANRPKIARMVNRAARYMRRRDGSVPPVQLATEEVDMLDDYLGPGFAHPTEEAVHAVERVARAEKLPLETTYTGKAMAALLDYARHHPGARLLFVDTFAESPALEEGDYRDLPERFWPVFDPAHHTRCRCLRAGRDPGFCWKRAP